MIELLLALTLYWDAPTERVDGTPLPATEIAGYQVYRDSESLEITEELSLKIDGKGEYSVRCIDTDGLVSEFSNSIFVKGNPNPPGQLRKNK